MAYLDLTDTAFRGAVMGGLEFFTFGQPCNYFKNQMQQAKRPSLNPCHWYRGCWVNAGAMVVSTMAFTSTFEMLKRSFESPLSAALMSGAFFSCIGTPFDYVVIHQQNTGADAKYIVKKVIIRKGFYGLWKGATLAMPAGMIHSVSMFYVNSIVKKRLSQKDPSHTAADAAAAAISGLTATFLAFPLDTLKTNYQSTLVDYPVRNISTIAKEIWKRQGILGFYKGVHCRILQLWTRFYIYTKLMN